MNSPAGTIPATDADSSQHPVYGWGVAALEAKREASREHQAKLAERRDRWIRRNRYYYANLIRLLQFLIESDKRVLSVRCQTGHLLAAVQPSRGVGVDISKEMVDIAKARHGEFEFVQSEIEDLELDEKFDYVLFTDITDVVDVQQALIRVRRHCHDHTRLVIYTYNHLWQPILEMSERIGLRMPMQEPNWLSVQDIENLLHHSEFEMLKCYRSILIPKRIPILSWLFNRFFAKLPLIKRLDMVNVIVARPKPQPQDPMDVSVSVIVPCRNEEGNIASAVERIPEMGRHTEIIFCDDKSTDRTADEVRRLQKLYPERDIKLVDGPGICKANNVWTGFDSATSDVLMILDADLTVMPEELPYFFEAIVAGRGEFINGSRLVYPMQKQAMKFSNMMGNKLFGHAFSFLLDTRIKDTLCGTKVIWRDDWMRIKPMVGTWGPKDRWGDFDLLFSAAKLNLKIVDLPVHYQDRVYGATKMVRVFSNGMNMLKMWLAAFWKLKTKY